MTPDQFESIVARANLAPSVHNMQPARWRRTPEGIDLFCDGALGLPVSDPEGRDMGLSCGAALEATVLAASKEGIGLSVEPLWQGPPGAQALAPVARLTLGEPVEPLPLAGQLDDRFTFRGPFDARPVNLFGWSPESAVLVTDARRIDRIAALNDAAALGQMRRKGVRRELLDWMRLGLRHPRYGIDGMSRAALRMAPVEARAAGLVLGPLWPLFDRLGLTAGLTAEAAATRTAPVIAGFHRAAEEDPVSSGRQYLRLWLAATSLGMAGWPMAALTDDPEARAEMERLLVLPPGRRLIQVLRFGMPTDAAPPRARRPLSELIV